MKRIGIITWHNYPNVGSALQAYALHTYINGHGGNAKIINYSTFGHPSLWFLRLLLSKFDCFIPKKISEKLHYRFISFESKYLKETHLLTTVRQLEALNDVFDVFVCGSDQIWAPNVYNDVYLLSFVNERNKKVSYAASIGLPRFPDSLIESYKKWFSRFDYISVREQQGADLIKNSFNLDCSVVLDPTLLLTRQEWEIIERKNKHPQRYVLCYLLGEQESHRKIVENFAVANNLGIICISRFGIDIRPKFMTNTDVGPREFIDYVHNADFVFTDSFHGVCFSVIFNKCFYVLRRFSNDDPINQNSRIENILSLLGLDSRLINEVPKTIEAIDYAPVNNRLQDLRENSHQFLKQAIEID